MKDNVRILSGSRRLRPEDIIFESDIELIEGVLNFYIACWRLDPDEVFGTNFNTDENDDYCNVYANFDVARGVVADDLEVSMWIGEENETAYFPLNDEEKAFIRKAMEAYCWEQEGKTLDQLCAELRAEAGED